METGRRTSMIPQSAGAGLGQQTGGNVDSDTREALTLLKMIGSCPWDEDDSGIGLRARIFLHEQYEREGRDKGAYKVTGKQLFWLRDIKDKLVERGIL